MGKLMKLKDKIKTFWEDTKNDLYARARGEVRIAPRGARGRVYAKKGAPTETQSGGGFAARVQPVVELEMVVNRADGKTDKYKVPGSATRLV